MFQIDVPSAIATQPAATSAGTAGFFTDGNPASGQQATIVPAEFLNATMMELLNILSAAGLNPNKSTYNQVATAIKTLLQQGSAAYALDTGTANTYQVAYTPAVTALIDGMKLRFKAKTANTGASTFAPNGLAASPIYGAAHSALQGGEIQPNSDIELIWNSSLNSGNGAWVILESTGGAVQIGAAQQSGQAVNLGQFNGLFSGNGYRKLPDGTIIQWGSGTFNSTTTNQTATITFPTAFPNNCYSVNLSHNGNAGNGSAGVRASVEGNPAPNKTGFTTVYSTTSSTTMYYFWMAIGN